MSGTAKVIYISIATLLTLLCIYALLTGQIVGDQLHVWQVVWGVYVWADAYSGFILISTLIYAYERRLGFTLLLFFVTCLTGNMVNALWLLWRGPDLYRRISTALDGRA